MPVPFLDKSSCADVTIKEGWCLKESGSTFLGNVNWRRRWFTLAQCKSDVTLSYFRFVREKWIKCC